MNDILPFLKELIENALLTRTCLASDATAGDTTIHLECMNWMHENAEVVVNSDQIVTIEDIDLDSKTITISSPLTADAPRGTDIRKIRAVNPPALYIGDYDGPVSPPAIHVYGSEIDSAPISIGGLSHAYGIVIDVMGEMDSHSRSYLDMQQITKELQQILIRFRKLNITARRYFWKIDPPRIEPGYVTRKGATLATSRITWMWHEEQYLLPDPPSEPTPTQQIQQLQAAYDSLANLFGSGERILAGTLTNSDGDIMPGITVSAVGVDGHNEPYTVSTVTDDDGVYELSVPSLFSGDVIAEIDEYSTTLFSVTFSLPALAGGT